MEHLSLEIFDLTGTGSKYAVLPEDTSITITDTSEIFASGDVWSYSFTLNTAANAHIFGTAGEMHGARLHEQVNRRRARLWVEGLPLYYGYLRLDDEVDVDKDGNVDVSFESGQKTFEDMIDGAKANQVPTIGNVRIGVALWRKRVVRCLMKLKAAAVFTNNTRTVDAIVTGLNGRVIEFDSDDEKSPSQQYPRMVFPTGEFKIFTGNTDEDAGTFSPDCINTDEPYTEDDDGTPTHPYCNVALCYQRYGYERKMEDGSVRPDYSTSPEAQRGYEYMPADRVNSAPNFFVIYWIRALMRHLGIDIEENQMMDVEDLRRLFFVNTDCAYKEPTRKFDYSNDMRWYRFGEGGRLVPERFDQKKNINKDESAFVGKIKNIGEPQYNHDDTLTDPIPTIDRVVVGIDEIDTSGEAITKQVYENNNSYLHDAYATSDCFPDADIADVIKALESGFGVRFLFNDNYQRVRIVLLRNIFRSKEVQEIACDVISDTKTENGIRGFRMTYGNTEDTHFYYKGFADLLPHKKPYFIDDSDDHDYSHWNLDAEYANLIHRVSAFDKTCYVTPVTGNAYGIKVDKDAKRYDELHPSLFEFAGFMDAEDGDCTGEENTIETVDVGFTPAIMNDLNFEKERSGEETGQRFALFVDEKMQPRRPDLNTEEDYNDPDAFYDVDGILYGKKDGKNYDYQKMMSDGIVKAGEFAFPVQKILSTPGLKLQSSVLARRLRADGSMAASPVTYPGARKVSDSSKPRKTPLEKPEVTLYDVAAGRATLDALLDQMTFEETIHLLYGHPRRDPSGTGSIGDSAKFGVSAAQTCDGPAGVRRSIPSSYFPCAALLAGTFDTGLLEEIGAVIGAEAAEADFDILLAPGLCIHRHPLCGRNFEYFSEDPFVSGVSAAAYVKGVQSQGVGATIKHFAGNNREMTRKIEMDIVSERAFREIYLRGFERAVKDADPWGIMTSYNAENGFNSSVNHGLLTGILRDEWGYKGITMTDWRTVEPIWKEVPAGNDVKMPGLLNTCQSDKAGFTDELLIAEALSALDRNYLGYGQMRTSAKRVLEFVMKTRRFKKEMAGRE